MENLTPLGQSFPEPAAPTHSSKGRTPRQAGELGRGGTGQGKEWGRLRGCSEGQASGSLPPCCFVVKAGSPELSGGLWEDALRTLALWGGGVSGPLWGSPPWCALSGAALGVPLAAPALPCCEHGTLFPQPRLESEAAGETHGRLSTGSDVFKQWPGANPSEGPCAVPRLPGPLEQPQSALLLPPGSGPGCVFPQLRGSSFPPFPRALPTLPSDCQMVLFL